MIKQTLAGLKILVTRPRDQTLHLVKGIEEAGGIPVLHPLLEITPVPDERVLKEQLLRLPLAKLAIFISPNAVRYGMAAVVATPGKLPESLQIATVGKGSAHALRELGVNNVIVPDHGFDSESLLAKLTQVEGWQIVIFRGNGGRELLGNELKKRGARVEYLTCYHRSHPQWDIRELLNVDLITVTSCESLEYLWQMLTSFALNYHEQGLKMKQIPLFVPHARIAELAREQGWRCIYQTGIGDEGLLTGLKAAYREEI